MDPSLAIDWLVRDNKAKFPMIRFVFIITKMFGLEAQNNDTRDFSSRSAPSSIGHRGTPNYF